MMKRTAMGLLMAVVACAAGCASGQSFVKKGYDFAGLDRVAVVDVQGDVRGRAAEDEVAAYCEMRLLSKGYTVVTRNKVEEMLAEQQFQASDVTTAEGAAAAGRILNVKGLMVVNIPQFGNRIDMIGRIIDVEDGTLLWSGTGSASTGRLLATVAGAAVGGAAGVAVGGDRTGKVVGGVAGAALGGVAGHELAPSVRTALQKAIREMLEGLPAR